MAAHISNDGLSREESIAEHTEKTRFLCDEKGKDVGYPISCHYVGYSMIWEKYKGEFKCTISKWING